MMNLTNDTYYSIEADREYLSCSQYEDFLTCEARAMAKLQGRYEKPESEAFLVGNYFHSFFESDEAFFEFCEENFDNIFKTKTTKSRGVEVVGKYAPFLQADKMIEAAKADPYISKLIDMDGENELIMTGLLFGKYPWKIKVDKYIPKLRMILDWKTVANIHEQVYTPNKGKTTFVEAFNYLFRAAVYCEIEKQYAHETTDPIFNLVCLSKQDPVDKEIISLNHRQRLDMELEKVSEHIGRIQGIKDGILKPRRCGKCDYCRATKKLSRIMPYYELEPNNRPPLEDEYDEYLEGTDYAVDE